MITLQFPGLQICSMFGDTSSMTLLINNMLQFCGHTRNFQSSVGFPKTAKPLRNPSFLNDHLYLQIHIISQRQNTGKVFKSFYFTFTAKVQFLFNHSRQLCLFLCKTTNFLGFRSKFSKGRQNVNNLGKCNLKNLSENVRRRKYQ